jgi:hypothetical protein
MERETTRIKYMTANCEESQSPLCGAVELEEEEEKEDLVVLLLLLLLLLLDCKWVVNL